MDWLTDSLRERLLEAGKRQAEADQSGLKCPLPVLTYVQFRGAGWMLASTRPDDPDIAFGLCHLPGGIPELGYVRLSEIARLRYENGSGPFEDPMFKDADHLDVTEYARTAAIVGQIALQHTVKIDDSDPSFQAFLEAGSRQKKSKRKR